MTISPSSVLFIGIPVLGGINSIGWDDIKGANPADYSVAVVNCDSLLDYIDGPLFRSECEFRGDLSRLSQGLCELVAAKGTVVVLSGNRLAPSELPGFGAYQWLPIDFDLKLESGSTINVLGQKWERYFARTSSWNILFDNFGHEPEPWSEIIPGMPWVQGEVNIVAVNHADEYVAVEWQFLFGPPNTYYPDFTPKGSIYVVPLPDTGTIEDAIILWLEDAGHR